MNMNNRQIEIIETKEGLPTASVNKILIHSKYYPIKESQKLLDNSEHIYINKDVVVVYGLAFGYHIMELLKRIDINCRIYIFDVDKEIIDIGKKLGLYNEIKKDNRVRIFTGYSEAFFKNFKEKLELVEDILIYKPSLKVLPESFEKFKMMLSGFEMAKIGIERFSSLMSENYEANLKIKSSGLKEFYKVCDVKNKPVIIVASGPSLDENINALKQINGKVKIFTVGSALRTLMNNGIKPDMITIIDSQEIVQNQLRGFEDTDIPLCFLNTASRWAVSIYNGPKFMFYNERNESDDIIINTGKTVAVAAMDIAVKGGASDIIFVGQDLAFINNKTHTQSFVETYNMSNSAPKSDVIYKKVIGVDGSMLNTTDGFLYFKYCIERIIEDNPQIKFINCSKGARIKGTVEDSLENVIQSMSQVIQ